MAPWSKTWTFFEGDWHEGNVPIIGARSHAAWMGSAVFDGARVFEGTAPDLEQHFARVNRSAAAMGLSAVVEVSKWLDLCRDGRTRFSADSALYVRPMYWAEQGGPGGLVPDAASTAWCLLLYEAPMPVPGGTAITLSRFRRPLPETAVLDAKAGALYPNNARALAEAQARGFDNALMCDALGNVAELTTANVFLARDGIVRTPAPTGVFLAGITRARVIALLRADGVAVEEASLRYGDFQDADEIFSAGNYAKVFPILRIDDRPLEPGPFFRLARRLYREFAHAGG